MLSEKALGSILQLKPAERFDVYLACPPLDVKPETDRLEKSLRSNGFTVARFDLDGLARSSAHRFEDLAEVIRACDNFVQIVGALPGAESPFGNQGTLVSAQFEAAKQAGIDRQIWRKPEIQPDQCREDHALFLRSCGCHVSSFEEFEQFLTKKIRKAKERANSAERRAKRAKLVKSSHAPIFVAIDASPEDNELGKMIAEALKGYVDTADWIDTNPNSKEMARAVKDNDAIVLVYGESPGGQKRVRKHFKYFRRLKWDARQEQFEIAVGNAAPKTAPPPPGGPDVHLINVRNGVDSDSLRSFLSSLGAVEG